MSVIAIDYDETITDNTPYPQTGNIREEARQLIPLLYNQGHTLVLWTARKEPYYSQCLQRLEEEGLLKYFTPIELIDRGVTGKIEADVYIDDKSISNICNIANIII